MYIKRLYYIIQLIIVLCLCSGVVTAQEKILFSHSTDFSIRVSSDDRLQTVLPGINAPMYSRLDVDNDGLKDIYIYDKHNRTNLVYILKPDSKYEYRDEYSNIFPELSDWVLLVDYDGDGKEDLWTRDDYHNSVKLYRNITTPNSPFVQFELVTKEIRAYTFSDLIDTTNLFCDKSNVPGIADLDGDGDIDFLTLQSTGLGVTLFLNNTIENNLPLHPPSFEMPDDCWGDFSEASITNDIFLERYKFCRSKYYRYKKHAGGSSILLFDADGDSDKDVLLGNAGFEELAFLENGKNDFVMRRDSIIAFSFNYPPSNPAKAKVFAASFLLQPALSGESARLFIAPTETDDANYYIDQSGIYPVYKNNASNGVYDFITDTGFYLPGVVKDFGAYSHPALGDLDGDGILDLLVAHNGNATFTKNESDRISYFKGEAPNKFIWKDDDFLNVSQDSIQGMSIALGDLNNDGKLDMILGSKSRGLYAFQNTSSGPSVSFSKINWMESLSLSGTFHKPHICDIDSDSIPDLLLGTREGNILAYKNHSLNSPTFTWISDTFGGININPLVWRSVQDPISQEWKDSLIHDIYGYSCISSIRDNQNVLHLLLTGKDGQLYSFIPELSDEVFGKYKKSNDYFYSIQGANTPYSLGYRSTINTIKHPVSGNIVIIAGNAGGGVKFLSGEIPSGLQTFDKTHLYLFPNPASQIIHIQTNQDFEKYRILDISGRKLLEHFGNEVDISSLPSGIYLLQILNSDYLTAHTKFIKL